MVILKRARFFTIVVAFIIGVSIIISSDKIRAIDYCNTEACKEAAARESEARQKAAEATQAAENLEQVVQGLEEEIIAIEAKIALNEKEAADLALQIKINEEKLAAQQSALATLLVDMHFDSDPDAIIILAGANSISELAEKQSRQETAKIQISQSAQNIRNLKKELENEKAAVERLVVEQTNQRNVIAQKRAEQSSLLEKYRDNAESFTAEAETARLEKEAAIAEETQRYNSTGVAGLGVNTYPYQSDCPHRNLAYSTQWGYVCQCTSYAGYKAYEHWGVYIAYWGNAYSWANSARARNYRVDTTPAPFTIAVSTAGEWGHVMWVESVNENGTINLSEYNNSYSSASHLPGDYGYRIGASSAGLYFIHFD